MTEPITPPRELMQQWIADSPMLQSAHDKYLATQAARWGADQELEACCEWLGSEGLAGYTSRELRAARRPKPPSLKDQALETLHSMRIAPVVINGINVNADVMNKYEIIRRALEQLDD